MNDPDLEFAGEFPTPSRAEWTAAVERVLRGRPFDDVLVSSTRDGLDIQPLYDEETDGGVRTPVDVDRVRWGWDVRQHHDATDPAVCARAVLEDLERGVTSVELSPPDPGWRLDSLRAATEGVLLDVAPVSLAPHADVDAARAFASVIEERGDAEVTRSWLGLDPVGEVVRGGFATSADVVTVAASLVSALPEGRTLTVDSTRYSEAGATEAQELAWSIATGVTYLRLLEDAGVGPAEAAATIGFRLAVGADQFTTMAFLRAARRLWARVLEVSGVDGGSQLQHAVTSRAMYSRRDPWVNILRGTIAALAAGVGGADAITVLPFDDAVGAPDGLARRVARNTQTLLIEESHLAEVIDPAAGAWFVESLTDRLAAAAWAELQSVEAAGGIEVLLADGSLAARVDDAWETRLAGLATRREAVTGVSEFPSLDEEPLDRPARAEMQGWPLRRLAAPFEELRDAADRHLAETGTRPTVHLATLGDLATHTARSTWVTNMLAVGGVVGAGADGDGALSPLEAEARFVEGGASVAVLCSSDAVYAERAASTVTALKEAGAALVAMAGEPGERRAALEATGVDEFWHEGIDVLDVLDRLHATLGVS